MDWGRVRRLADGSFPCPFPCLCAPHPLRFGIMPTQIQFILGLYTSFIAYHYYLEAVLGSQMADITVTCSPSEYVTFQSPPGLTCGQYVAPFISQAPGYLANPDSTGLCQYCPIASGRAYLQLQLTWTPDNKWRNLGIMCGFMALNIITTGLFIYRWVAAVLSWCVDLTRAAGDPQTTQGRSAVDFFVYSALFRWVFWVHFNGRYIELNLLKMRIVCRIDVCLDR